MDGIELEGMRVVHLYNMDILRDKNSCDLYTGAFGKGFV